MTPRYTIQMISRPSREMREIPPEVPNHRAIYAVSGGSEGEKRTPIMFTVPAEWFNENQPRPGDTVYWEKGSKEPILIKKETNCDQRTATADQGLS